MKKRKAYKPKSTSVPMLVNRELNKTVETLNENAMLLAFRFGHAQVKHFDQLALMANMMEVALQTKPCETVLMLSSSLRAITKSIKARYDRANKLGLSGEELAVLKKCLIGYDDYWKRQTTTLYNECVHEVNAFYEELKQQKEAA
jgi:hypothetical protein